MGTQNIKIVPVKTCDFGATTAIAAFTALNQMEGKAIGVKSESWPYTIVTAADPAQMLFPAGWYFAKHALRNKHHSTTGAYSEIDVMDPATHSVWTTHAVETARQCHGKDFAAPVCARTVAALNNGAKLVGPTHVLVKTGPDATIKYVEGWSVENACSMGFLLRSGDRIVKIFFR